jgi:hypothetical protein
LNTLTSDFKKSWRVTRFSRTSEYHRWSNAIGVGCKRKPDKSMSTKCRYKGKIHELHVLGNTPLVIERLSGALNVPGIEERAMLLVQYRMQGTGPAGQAGDWTRFKSNDDGEGLEGDRNPLVQK